MSVLKRLYKLHAVERGSRLRCLGQFAQIDFLLLLFLVLATGAIIIVANKRSNEKDPRALSVLGGGMMKQNLRSSIEAAL